MGKVINVQMDEDFYNKIITGDSGGSKPEYIGFEIYQPGFGDGVFYRYSKYNLGEDDTWEDLLRNDKYPTYGRYFSSDENNNVTYDGNILYHDCEGEGWNAQLSNPVKTTDIVESKCYYLEGGNSGIG